MLQLPAPIQQFPHGLDGTYGAADYHAAAGIHLPERHGAGGISV